MATEKPKLKLMSSAHGGKKTGRRRRAKRATNDYAGKAKAKATVKMEPFPLGMYAMKIQGMLKNPKYRNQRVMSRLWNETNAYWRLALAKYLLVRDVFPPDQRKNLEEQARRYAVRMKNYKAVLALRPVNQANIDAAVVRGLLIDIPNDGAIADYLFPMSFVNQSDAILENMIEANREFFLGTPKKLAAEIAAMVEDAADVLDSAKGHWGKFAAGILATVVGGVIVVKLTDRRRR